MINGTWTPPKDTTHDDKNRTIRAWVTYREKLGGYVCNLVLENGFPIYNHFCSDPGCAPGDLWNGRKERQQRWKDAGLKLEIVGVVTEDDLPQHVFDNNKTETYVPFLKKYFPEYVETEPEVAIEAAEKG